ncbi:DUF1878 family protein [Bacillus massiliglaciei]|uniref:DUF1878 family protein n=1 Tax=Bacillus massiliglaciei TaxID=1816693 RepID=UPI000DA62372|nr:DUF1878 family protein [Bacillus massiliglaciei]
MENLDQEIETLRYHQKLLMNVIKQPAAKLDLLFVERNFTEKESEELLKICEVMSKKYEIEKAEGFVHFQPLFVQLEEIVNPKIKVKELVQACLSQGLFIPFMTEMAQF